MSLKGLSQQEKRIVLTMAGALLIVAAGVCVILALTGVSPLIVYRHGEKLEPEPLMELLREGTDILELFSRD